MGEAKINHLMYADDVVLVAPTALGLCKLLEVCDRFANDHDVMFNSSKSSVLVFRCKLLKNNVYSRFYLKNEEIPVQKDYKYLGHIICDDLRDEPDISRQRKKIYAQGNTIIRKFSMCTESVKTTLFRTYCTSLYTAHLWWNHSHAAINKLYVAYNNIFRFLCHEPRWCSASFMFITRGLETCPMLIRKYVYGFMCRLKSTHNVYINHIVTKTDTMFRSRIWSHWMRLLHLNNHVFSCK